MQLAISYSIVLLNGYDVLIIVCCFGQLCPACYIASYVRKVIPYTYGRIFRTIRVWSYHIRIHVCTICVWYKICV